MRTLWTMTALVVLTVGLTVSNKQPVNSPKQAVDNTITLVAADIAPASAKTATSIDKSQDNPVLPSERENWIVKAVRKADPSVVALKVKKPGRSKETVGTGVIVDERGYIITNKHVVSEGIEVRVILADKRTYVGTVKFEEASFDLAIVKIEAPRKLQALKLGPASDLMRGEDVVAIGHPFGYEGSVSTGIISATGRKVEMPGGVELTNLIQTTAPINPGNSGGPLLNRNGDLIGINVALRSDAQNIAFALHADMVTDFLKKRMNDK